ncbi:hypothetical protein BDC45DRAFT_584750 [Circinella umbellata]|nr:hypothetical protein BDC45DRAFT_584750 [Circinella umbellata]
MIIIRKAMMYRHYHFYLLLPRHYSILRFSLSRTESVPVGFLSKKTPFLTFLKSVPVLRFLCGSLQLSTIKSNPNLKGGEVVNKNKRFGTKGRLSWRENLQKQEHDHLSLIQLVVLLKKKQTYWVLEKTMVLASVQVAPLLLISIRRREVEEQRAQVWGQTECALCPYKKTKVKRQTQVEIKIDNPCPDPIELPYNIYLGDYMDIYHTRTGEQEEELDDDEIMFE